MQILGILKEN